jgi:4-hydroxybenzoate polyprenyltransferase
LLALSGWSAGLDRIFYVLLIAAAAFVFVELTRWRMDDPENCRRRFENNRNFGFIVLIGIILGQLL